jgi:hypothetical protein
VTGHKTDASSRTPKAPVALQARRCRTSTKGSPKPPRGGTP